MPCTSIDSEERAYNTSTGSHWGSKRHGRVRFPDGTIRTVTLGIPDTFFTIPAHGRLHGRYVTGYISVADDGEYEFTIVPVR